MQKQNKSFNRRTVLLRIEYVEIGAFNQLVNDEQCNESRSFDLGRHERFWPFLGRYLKYRNLSNFLSFNIVYSRCCDLLMVLLLFDY